MITPKGRLIGIERTEPKQAFEKLRRGYALVSWKDSGDIYIGCVVFDDGKPILADLEFVKSKNVLKGREALERILNVEYATIELYELDRDMLAYAISMNEDTKIEEVEEKEPEIPKEEERKEPKLTLTIESNLEDFLSTIGNFTGLLVAKSDDREVKVYLKNGNIIGAEARIAGEKYKGKSALFYLNFHGKIFCYDVEDVDSLVSDDIKTEETLAVDREEILRKYKIKLPTEIEIEELLKSADIGTSEDEEKTPEEGSKKSFRGLFKKFRRK